jgi:hypothetical protein
VHPVTRRRSAFAGRSSDQRRDPASEDGAVSDRRSGLNA